MSTKGNDKDRKSSSGMSKSESRGATKTVTYRFALDQIRDINISLGTPTNVVIPRPPVSPGTKPPADPEPLIVIIRKPPGFVDITVGPNGEPETE